MADHSPRASCFLRNDHELKICVIQVRSGPCQNGFRQANIRWAREKALPEIARLIAKNDDFNDSYKLAEEAEVFIPHDPTLTGLFSKCSLHTSACSMESIC